jgi:hypothetical protein
MDTSHIDLGFGFDQADLSPIWHNLGSGACIAALVTLVRLGLEFVVRHGERKQEQEDRRRTHERDAEARLERMLQDRLSEADRRLERCELEIDTERDRRVAVEREYAVLVRAYELLEERCAIEERCANGHGLSAAAQRGPRPLELDPPDSTARAAHAKTAARTGTAAQRTHAVPLTMPAQMSTPASSTTASPGGTPAAHAAPAQRTEVDPADTA